MIITMRTLAAAAARSAADGRPVPPLPCQEGPPGIAGATEVRAYHDRATGSSVRNAYVSSLCPVVICPYLCTPDIAFGASAGDVLWHAMPMLGYQVTVQGCMRKTYCPIIVDMIS